jgi:HSP20 family protein
MDYFSERRSAMAIMRYRDWDPLKEMAKLFDWKPAKMMGWEMPEMRFPALDVEEKGDSFIVKAEIPGVDPEHMEVELHGDQLLIRGEKKEEKEEKDEEKKYYYKERSFGSFSRSVALGVELDPEDVKADYRDGVLTVTLKKAESRKARKIDIKKSK